jgi:hypothetical protein
MRRRRHWHGFDDSRVATRCSECVCGRTRCAECLGCIPARLRPVSTCEQPPSGPLESPSRRASARARHYGGCHGRVIARHWKPVKSTANEGLLFIGERVHGRLEPKMDHLVCFMAALLGAHNGAVPDDEQPPSCRPGRRDPWATRNRETKQRTGSSLLHMTMPHLRAFVVLVRALCLEPSRTRSTCMYKCGQLLAGTLKLHFKLG